MEPKPFRPSINWAEAFHDSVLWTAKAWAISAVVVLVVLVLMRYFTVWGRQYWRITGAYFTGRRAVPVWLMFGVLLFSVIVAVRLNVLFSYQSNDLYTALQTAFEGIAVGNNKVKNSGIHGFWMSLAIFCLLASLFIARVVLDIYLTQRFIIAWRVWLTGHLTDDWLDGKAYYRDLFIDNTIDNPDQRIQQDVDIFTAGVGAHPEHPVQRYEVHVVVRRGPRRGVGDLLYRDPVESVGSPEHPRLPVAARTVLGRFALRVARDGRGVLAGAPADLAEL